MNIWTKKIWPWLKLELYCMSPPTNLEIFDRFVDEETVKLKGNEEARVEKIFRFEYEDKGILVLDEICSNTVLTAMDKHFHCTLKVTELPVGLFNQDHIKRFDYGRKSVNDIIKSEGELRDQRNGLLGSVGRLEMELGVEHLKVKSLEAAIEALTGGDKPKEITKIKPLNWAGRMVEFKFTSFFEMLAELKNKQDEIIGILRGEK